ncbi:MAG: chorismate synthase [Ruminococcaceae bacterium]|nr:chorismate synthase [Oscillospiraceae bacterium]
MKNTFGNSVAVTLFGESHGEYIGAVIDGLAPGVEINREYISHMLTLRRPEGKISTQRSEKDEFKIISGVINDLTTGTPITVLIPNENVKSGDYSQMKTIARPSHADYSAECKYHGYQDSRGGGHFSGRITAALVAAGAICKYALEKKGIHIGTHVKKCAGVSDREFCDLLWDIKSLNEKKFAVLNENTEDKMKEAILEAAEDGDSVGGILETAVVGMPSGVGEPWFDSLEGMLSHMMFSIPAVKGIEFGAGFAFADMKGSEANDPMRIAGDKVYTVTNNNGGINGGITNGMPVIFRTVIKPTPTIFKPQDTINFKTMTEEVLEAKGRHDPAIVHRARVVQDAATAIVMCDVLAARFGTDFIIVSEKKD